MDLKTTPISELLMNDKNDEEINNKSSILEAHHPRITSFDEVNNSEVVEMSRELKASEASNNRFKGLMAVLASTV